MKKAYFAGGCFWLTESKFSQLNGVIEVISGYMGGDVKNPTYKEVCTSKTGHAETIEINYDESIITYKELINYFFKFHNPTTLNRQGMDIGPQYRSVVFYLDDTEKELANEIINEINNSNKHLDKIVTEVVAASVFYKAELYHQNYYKNQNIFISIK